MNNGKNSKLSDDRDKHKTLFLFFKKPGEIDIDLAERIAETIVAKLVNRAMVTLGKEKTFSETYIFSGD